MSPPVRPLVEALWGRPTPSTPVWVMRQAGRHLPEYRALRAGVSFQEAVSTPSVAAELTMQPVERYGMDGAVVFADIMTPLEAMGVEIEFTPGPSLRPHTLDEVARLAPLDPATVGHVAETIALVRSSAPAATAVIGFCGAPLTLLAYLIEGGGSKDFVSLRAALRADPPGAAAALEVLAESMSRYLRLQVDAGADAVQLFDSWAGVTDRATFARLVAPAARMSLAEVAAPTIYFAPHAHHTLDLHGTVGASAVGLDWRVPIDEAWETSGAAAVQGNLDPGVLLTDPDTIASAVGEVLGRVGGRPGHVFNLGHGVDRRTPPRHVASMVEAVRS